MALNARLRQQMEQVLAVVDDHDTPGPRLRDDARRLWRQVRELLRLNLVTATHETDALELACYALQMPMRHSKLLPVGRLGRTNLKDRAEQAAELLVGVLGDQIEESLLDRTTRLLQELPQRPPVLDEAKLLADAVNLEDFGMIGLVHQVIQLTRRGGGVRQVVEGCDKREQYGYWEARLKDGFHFQAVRAMARQRLEHVRQACAMLREELA